MRTIFKVACRERMNFLTNMIKRHKRAYVSASILEPSSKFCADEGLSFVQRKITIYAEIFVGGILIFMS